MAVPSVPVEDFKTLFRGHPGGDALITADTGQGPVALTASSVASLMHAAAIAIGLCFRVVHSRRVLARAATVVVHFLYARDIEAAKLSATSGIDRFA